MASYNLMKRADRARLRADRQGELDAIKAGLWPRDLNDAMRWGLGRADADHARKCITVELEYLDGVGARIDAGELVGWEPEGSTLPAQA